MLKYYLMDLANLGRWGYQLCDIVSWRQEATLSLRLECAFF